MNRVAVTGIGIVSSIGSGAVKVADSLKAGRSGIHFMPERIELGFRSGLCAVISDFVPPQLDRKRRKTMTEFCLQAYAAARDAVSMAAWSENDIETERTGLIIGNDTSAKAIIEQNDILRKEKSTFPIGASLVFQALTSTVTMNLNTIFRNRGASWTISAACSSGSHAVGQASDLIALGRQDRVICGGAQEINPESISSFDATNAFSIRHESPAAASRPFDSERDGLIPGGGAAMLALENYDMAVKRGAIILGEIISYSFSSDGCSLNVPSGEGLRYCMTDCIKNSGVSHDKIDYICAHATSTIIGDAAEAKAIYEVFGPSMPWVSSTKSMTGHEMWMSGAAQTVYSIIMGMESFIAPNINFSKQEGSAPKLKIAKETIALKPSYILINSAGFGGTNSCLLLKTRV